MYCHFSNGIGDPKYMPVISVDPLTKILMEALDGYNEINAAMNLVLFIDAVAHVLRIKLVCSTGDDDYGGSLTSPFFYWLALVGCKDSHHMIYHIIYIIFTSYFIYRCFY